MVEVLASLYTYHPGSIEAKGQPRPTVKSIFLRKINWLEKIWVAKLKNRAVDSIESFPGLIVK
jgi:hypothetical protein